jgi:hypothetical protein
MIAKIKDKTSNPIRTTEISSNRQETDANENTFDSFDFHDVQSDVCVVFKTFINVVLKK